MFYQKDLAATLSRIADVEASNAGTRPGGRAQGGEGLTSTPANLAAGLPNTTGRWGVCSPRKTWPAIMSRLAPPVTINYKGYDVYSTGPWGQGPTFPQALKILEGYDLASMGHNSAEYIHTVNQALNLAFADREQYVGDPDFVDVPMNEMLAEE